MKNAIKEITPHLIEALDKKIKGRMVPPSDTDYGETRKVYNGMIDKKPGGIRNVHRCRGCNGRCKLWTDKRAFGRHKRGRP